MAEQQDHGEGGMVGTQLLPVPQELKVDRGTVYDGPALDETELSGYLLGGPLPSPIVDSGPLGSLPKEGYELRIDRSRVLLAYADKAGAFYGVQTLRQLLTATGADDPLRCGVISDWPDLPVRGFMIDISRSKVPTMVTLRELVEILALLKINQLQLYTEHTFAYAGHEEVWNGASPVTAAELRELDDLCRDHAIELVGNQNSFGHMTPWLTLPRYRHLAEAPDGFVDPWGIRRDYPYSLSPAVPATLEFLDELYGQLLPNLRSGRLNVGCDETFDLGQGRSAELCRSKGKAAVYLDYLKGIHGLVRRHGKQMLFYADIVQQHPETIPLLPKDSIAIEWGYEAGHPFEEHCRRLAEAELEFYVAPGTSSWNSFAGRWGVARENIVASLAAAQRWGASGMLLTEWGDNGYLQPFVTMLPGLVFAAGGAWNRGSLLHEPWSWLSSRLFGERVGTVASGNPQVGPLSSALRLLSELYRLHPGDIPNASIFGVVLLLFDLSPYQGHLAAFDRESRRKARETLREVADLLAEAGKAETGHWSRPEPLIGRPRSKGHGGVGGIGARALREVEFAKGMIELALDAADGAPMSVLRHEAARLETEHRALWNAGYRPGGLELSCSYLKKRVSSWAAS